MIWKRALSCQMTPAKFDTVAVDFAVGGPGNTFRATGQTMVFPGFYAVYHEDQDDAVEEEDKRLPALDKGDTVPILKLYGEQHFTQPPPRYSEASLVKSLEQYGIGRPSTYASIISTLQNREYVVLEKKRFQPTDVGRVVNKFLTEHFAHWVDYEFTAKLEDELDDISNGKEEWVPVLERFWKDFSAQIGEKESVSRKDVTQEVLDEDCPKCKAHKLSIRLGRRGRFIGCSGFPDCDYTRNLDGSGDSAEGPAKRDIGIDPKTKKPIQLLQGPYGWYFQLGEAEGDKKPKRVSLPKNIAPEAADLEIALEMLALPARPRPASGNGQEGHRRDRALRPVREPRRAIQVDPEGRERLRHRAGTGGGPAQGAEEPRRSRGASRARQASRRRPDGRALLGQVRPVREARQGERNHSRQGRDRHLHARGGASRSLLPSPKPKKGKSPRAKKAA